VVVDAAVPPMVARARRFVGLADTVEELDPAATVGFVLLDSPPEGGEAEDLMDGMPRSGSLS
jgi:hypothetical protein